MKAGAQPFDGFRALVGIVRAIVDDDCSYRDGVAARPWTDDERALIAQVAPEDDGA
jgi:hypothetical protein